jgi:phosphoglycerate dehydrogenase-like enzyme
MKKAVYILSDRARNLIYGVPEREEISRIVELAGGPYTKESIPENLENLKDVEIIFSGWGGPKIDGAFLRHAPNLKVVFYGAGSVRPVVTDEFWDRGVRITSGYGANAVPVAEYTLAATVLCLKNAWALNRKISAERTFSSEFPGPSVPGTYGTTVGIVSLGMVGRGVCKMLKNLDVRIIAHDPYTTPEQARQAGADSLCSLEEIFSSSDVVSLHAPLTAETENMVRGRHFRLMKKGASFINLSRGGVVHQGEMIEFLKVRPDIQAVLDVSNPEPPEAESPLYDLPNVFFTPHIAGSLGEECRRMGQFMIEECRRYLAGEPLRWEITRERLPYMA